MRTRTYRVERVTRTRVDGRWISATASSALTERVVPGGTRLGRAGRGSRRNENIVYSMHMTINHLVGPVAEVDPGHHKARVGVSAWLLNVER